MLSLHTTVMEEKIFIAAQIPLQIYTDDTSEEDVL